MPKDITKISQLSVELASYSAVFNASGLTLVGELRSDNTYALHVTKGGTLFATPQIAGSVKEAANALVAELGLSPRGNHPYFP